MTPWRAMLLAPLLAATIVLLCFKAPEAIVIIQSLPYLGPFLKRTMNPNAPEAIKIIGILCPAIPAIFGVAMFRLLISICRDFKAQRIRARRRHERESREAPGGATVEQLARNKEAIDNRRKTI